MRVHAERKLLPNGSRAQHGCAQKRTRFLIENRYVADLLIPVLKVAAQ